MVLGFLCPVFGFRFWDGWGKERDWRDDLRVVRNKATAQTELGPPMGELRDSEVAATSGAGDGFGFSVEGRPSPAPPYAGCRLG